MQTRFAEFLLEASQDPDLAILCREGAGREGLTAAMERYGLSEAERNLVLNAAEPGEMIVKAYRKTDGIVKAYRKVHDAAFAAG